MGIDLGLKIPAVAVTSIGKTRFFGNGRQNKYIRRKYQQRRRKLGKLKKLSAIQEGVSIIKLERLEIFARRQEQQAVKTQRICIVGLSIGFNNSSPTKQTLSA